MEDWRKNTVYAAGYKAEDNTIVWFWKAVQAFDSEQKSRLLQFVTGTSKVPMNGFTELQGEGASSFIIESFIHIRKIKKKSHISSVVYQTIIT